MSFMTLTTNNGQNIIAYNLGGIQFIPPFQWYHCVWCPDECVLCDKVKYLIVSFLCVLLALNFRSICCFVASVLKTLMLITTLTKRYERRNTKQLKAEEYTLARTKITRRRRKKFIVISFSHLNSYLLLNYYNNPFQATTAYLHHRMIREK